MVYHLARVVNWIQFQSIDYYATNSLSSVYQNPFAEYVILHLTILSKGNFYLSNLVQWFAFINCIIAISYLVKVLGGHLQSQIFASFLLATLPMAILQSNTTQNDVVAMMFLIFTAVFIYSIKANFYSFKLHVLLGLSVGLAILSKGTSFIYLTPFAIFYAFFFFKHFNIQAIKLSGVVVVLILALNGNHWKNNYQTFNKPLSPNYGYLIDDNYSKCFTCNGLKNTALQLQIPFIDEQPVNKVVTHLIKKFDLERENCKWSASPNLESVTFRFNEDYAANPFHFLLFLISVCIYIFKANKKNNLTVYLCCLLGIAITFNLLLTWQVWHPRLHLPILGLACAFIAITIKAKFSRYAVALLLFAFAIVVILKNDLKPILKNNILKLTEQEQLFTIKKDLKPVFEDIATLIEPAKNIGLANTGASWEFPFWCFFNKDYQKQIRSVFVENETSRYASKDFEPEIIISQRNIFNKKSELTYNNTKYIKKYPKKHPKSGVCIFVKEN